MHATVTMSATSSPRGTVRWMAPELLDMDFDDLEADTEDADASLPTQATDTYALGITIWEVCGLCQGKTWRLY
jgi:serine/threonine protein kinase